MRAAKGGKWGLQGLAVVGKWGSQPPIMGVKG